MNFFHALAPLFPETLTKKERTGLPEAAMPTAKHYTGFLQARRFYLFTQESTIPTRIKLQTLFPCRDIKNLISNRFLKK